jgi:hypothetical protein
MTRCDNVFSRARAHADIPGCTPVPTRPKGRMTAVWDDLGRGGGIKCPRTRTHTRAREHVTTERKQNRNE